MIIIQVKSFQTETNLEIVQKNSSVNLTFNSRAEKNSFDYKVPQSKPVEIGGILFIQTQFIGRTKITRKFLFDFDCSFFKFLSLVPDYFWF